MLPDLAVRAIPGFVIVVAVSLAASYAHVLSASGVAAALVVGTLSVLAGASWAAMLLAFFVSASALSLWHLDRKRTLLADVTPKGERRDAAQVIANGGIFAMAALGQIVAPSDMWYSLAAGALATAACDTWSTEVGTAVGGTPRHLLSGAALLPGISGGITAAGTAAGVAGAAGVAVLAWWMRWPVPVHATIAGGILGGLTDSLLGATVQERRWCPRCERVTERRVHGCGTPTEVRGGMAGFGNDAVNLTSVIAGAVATGVLS